MDPSVSAPTSPGRQLQGGNKFSGEQGLNQSEDAADSAIICDDQYHDGVINGECAQVRWVGVRP